MKPIVLFGAGKIAQVVHYYMAYESDWEVAAFACDREFISGDTFEGKPLVPFEDVTFAYPPESYDIFVAVGYQDLNGMRTRKVVEAKQKGYRLPSFVHPQSGLPRDTELGENCFVMNNVCVHPRVKLGNNVFVWSGAMVGHHSTIGDNCWLTSTASICGVVTVGRNCFFAANTTVANDVSIGDDCFLGANTLVAKDLPAGSVVAQSASKPLRLNSKQFLRMSSFG